jgi:hypothetical protein
MTVWFDNPEESGNIADVGVALETIVTAGYTYDAIIVTSPVITGHTYSVRSIGSGSGYAGAGVSGRALAIPTPGSHADVYFETYWQIGSAQTASNDNNFTRFFLQNALYSGTGENLYVRTVQAADLTFSFDTSATTATPVRHRTTLLSRDAFYRITYEQHIGAVGAPASERYIRFYIDGLLEWELTGATVHDSPSYVGIGSITPGGFSPQPNFTYYDSIYLASEPRGGSGRAAFKLAVA